MTGTKEQKLNLDMSLSKIHNAESLDKQFNDLFRVGLYGKKELIRNPHNIKWILENFCKDKELVNLYEGHIDSCIINKQAFSTNNKLINELIDEEEVIIGRMQDLVKKGLDISNKCNFVTKRNNFAIIKMAVELGLDVNHQTKEGNTLLRLSLMRCSESIQNWIFKHPKTDISIKDMNGISCGVLALFHNNFNMSQEIFEKNPEQFVEIYYKENTPNFKDKNILHLIGEKKRLSKKNKIIYENFLQQIVDYIVKTKPELLNQLDSNKKTPWDNNFLDMIMKSALNTKLEQSLDLKENNNNNNKKLKI